MGHYVPQTWEPIYRDGAPRRLRRAGTYRAYIPDTLMDHPLTISPSLARRITDTIADLRDAAAAVHRVDLGGLSDFFLRTEVTASSAIEGEHASPRKVALADFTGYGRINATAVVRNLALVRTAMDRMATAPRLDLQDLVDLQRNLIPHAPGLRTAAVWIHGSTPLDAHYVAPPADLVPTLMGDLLAYANDADVDPLTRAATVHAAFMTIHPFNDGNGRVGRALTNVLLTRDDLGGRTTIPLSVALMRDRSTYFDQLTRWQRQDDTTGDLRPHWIAYFADALSAAATLARDLSAAVDTVRTDALAAVAAARTRAVRADATLTALITDLVHHPVSSAATVAARYGVSRVAARAALEELAAAGVLRRERVDRGREIAYTADAILDLVAGDWTHPDTQLEP